MPVKKGFHPMYTQDTKGHVENAGTPAQRLRFGPSATNKKGEKVYSKKDVELYSKNNK